MIFRIINNLLSYAEIRLRKITSRRLIESLWIDLTPNQTNISLSRVGNEADGGYVIANFSQLPDLLISPGVGDTSDFELYFAENGIKCILIDGSVTKPPKDHHNFVFINKCLGSRIDSDCISLKEIQELYPYSNGVLQMDIEGAEYEIINYLKPQDLSKFTMIVIEIHDLYLMLDPDFGYFKVRQLVDKLIEHHVPVHAHPNNIGGYFKCFGTKFPNIVEMTLIRRDLAGDIGRKIKPDTSLDRPNSTKHSDLKFPVLRDASMLE